MRHELKMHTHTHAHTHTHKDMHTKTKQSKNVPTKTSITGLLLSSSVNKAQRHLSIITFLGHIAWTSESKIPKTQAGHHVMYCGIVQIWS